MRGAVCCACAASCAALLLLLLTACAEASSDSSVVDLLRSSAQSNGVRLSLACDAVCAIAGARRVGVVDADDLAATVSPSSPSSAFVVENDVVSWTFMHSSGSDAPNADAHLLTLQNRRVTLRLQSADAASWVELFDRADTWMSRGACSPSSDCVSFHILAQRDVGAHAARVAATFSLAAEASARVCGPALDADASFVCQLSADRAGAPAEDRPTGSGMWNALPAWARSVAPVVLGIAILLLIRPLTRAVLRRTLPRTSSAAAFRAGERQRRRALEAFVSRHVDAMDREQKQVSGLEAHDGSSLPPSSSSSSPSQSLSSSTSDAAAAAVAAAASATAESAPTGALGAVALGSQSRMPAATEDLFTDGSPAHVAATATSSTPLRRLPGRDGDRTAQLLRSAGSASSSVRVARMRVSDELRRRVSSLGGDADGVGLLE